MTRTYGTYRYVAPSAALADKRGHWELTLEPAVRMRARRTFGRTQQTRTMAIEMFDTVEVCRDIAWFMTRFPLEPADPESKRRLTSGAKEHKLRETQILEALSGATTRAQVTGDRTPKKEPREYQQIAVDLLRARGRLLLTDEVGLGKTFTGLLNLIHDDALPALIVPPTHLPRRWVTELTEAFPWLSYHVAKHTTPPASVVAGHHADITIVPYSKLDGWAGYIQGHMASVVFDEVQELRAGVATLKGAAAALVAEPANYVLGLTATPVYNYGGEIWNIYDILAPAELGSREEFTREWGQTINGKLGVADPHALGSYLREQGLMLGRTRKQVGRELPKTVKVHQLVDSKYEALADVKERSKALAEVILSAGSTPMEKMQAAGYIDMEMRQATGVDKAPFVADFVRMLLESEERVVLWGWHRDVYEIWLRELAEFNPAMYTGSESPKQKAAAEDAFTAPMWITTHDADGNEYQVENPHAARILIMSLRSGAGVDGLQKVCRVGVFGELDWSPQVHEQAIGRLRRDGMSDDPPVIYFLTSTEGSDPVILDVLQIKRQQAEPMISPDGKLLANATTDAARGRKLAEQILGITTHDQETTE